MKKNELFYITHFFLTTVERVYFERIYFSRMANQHFRDHVFFANGQKAVTTVDRRRQIGLHEKHPKYTKNCLK